MDPHIEFPPEEPATIDPVPEDERGADELYDRLKEAHRFPCESGISDDTLLRTWHLFHR